MEKKLITLFALGSGFNSKINAMDQENNTILNTFVGEERDRIHAGCFAGCLEMFLRRNEKYICKNYDSIIESLLGIIEYANNGAEDWYFEDESGPYHVYVECRGLDDKLIEINGEHRHLLFEKVRDFIVPFSDNQEYEGLEYLNITLRKSWVYS
jgi:hypothetical protein